MHLDLLENSALTDYNFLSIHQEKEILDQKAARYKEKSEEIKNKGRCNKKLIKDEADYMNDIADILLSLSALFTSLSAKIQTVLGQNNKAFTQTKCSPNGKKTTLSDVEKITLLDAIEDTLAKESFLSNKKSSCIS
ncbi:MAG: hypothetical protein HEEMFOPI_00546 [Holosporales bacterium]